MILKSLEMQGFKSFPDKTVLEFNKGITAVVGPNGSGKSNISDAVRWVLGEQSTKNLRGSKMEDVVFMGTDLRKAKGFAEVTLRFDNRDRSLSKDTDEVSVTRRYYRSGESEYLINGENSRLRDINELFMDTGLGRDGYSIVGQGKIAEMVSSKTGERRDMLEEAAGISHFRYRRNDANKRLAAAEGRLQLDDGIAPLPGEPLQHRMQELLHSLRDEGALKEQRRILIFLRCRSAVNAGNIRGKFRLQERAAKHVRMRRDKLPPGLEHGHGCTVHGMRAGMVLLLTTRARGSVALKRALNFCCISAGV